MAALAHDFNRMGSALEERNAALEKAVTDLRDANANLRHARAGLDRAERLAAVGSLAAGVAHEVGNPMAAVLTFVELAKREGEKRELGEHGMQLLAKAAREGERVRVILAQLLDFSKPPRMEKRAVDLVGAVEQTLDLVRSQTRYVGVSFALECAPEFDAGAPAISADRGVLAQVLLNLVINAADATKGHGERVVVRLAPCVFAERRGDRAGTGVGGRWDAIECAVCDDGPGVPDDVRARIFDPFFTTKEPGEGTGLGLANVQRFVEQLDATVECDRCEALGGAAFRVRFPIAREARAGAVQVRAPRD